MKSFKVIKGGVRKRHSWGYSEIYQPNFEDCFTREELVKVIEILEKVNPNDPKIKKCKKKLSE